MTYVEEVTIKGQVDSGNSTTTPLGISGVFTGTSYDISNCGIVFVNVYSDQASATDGLSLQQSSDGTNWDHTDDYTIAAGATKNYSINPHSRYFRVVYTNGAVAQTTFRLQTVLKSQNAKASSHRIKDTIVGDDDAVLMKAALTGENGNGDWHNVKTTADGNLTISDNSSGLAIAEGNVTGHTFVHKFGQAPDFDTGDGLVTIWDGANDGLLGGGAMSYTYSSTADIDTISSSNAGDTVDIEIQGLDTSGNLTTQTVTLTGQTDATLTTALKRVFRMKNVGSTDLAGQVYLRTNGSTQTSGVPDTANTVRAVINDGNNQTLMAIYTVPTGKTAYVRSWYAATAGANKTSNYIIDLYARPSGQVFQLKHRSALEDGGTSQVQYQYDEPAKYDAGTDIEMQTSITASGITEASVAGGFDLVLVDD